MSEVLAHTSKKSPLRVRQARLALVFMLPSAILVGVFVLYPLGRSVWISLTNWDGISARETFIGLGNYLHLFTDSVFALAIQHNLVWVVFGTAGGVGLGLAAALLLYVRPRGSALFRTVFFVPQIVGGAIVGIIWLQLYQPEFGAIFQLGKVLGLNFLQRGFLGAPEAVMPAVLTTGIWSGFGFYMIILLAGLQAVDRELVEAAMLDGAGALARFRNVILPQIANSMNLAIVLAITGSLKVFDIIWVMTQGGPANGTEVIATYAYLKAFSQFDSGYAAALTVVMTLVALGLSLVFIRLRERGSDA